MQPISATAQDILDGQQYPSSYSRRMAEEPGQRPKKPQIRSTTPADAAAAKYRAQAGSSQRRYDGHQVTPPPGSVDVHSFLELVVISLAVQRICQESCG